MRLWLRLFIAIATLVVAALALLLLAQQHGFRRGLLDYVNQLQAQRLPPVVAALVTFHEQTGSWRLLHEQPGRFDQLVRHALGLRALPPRPPFPGDRRFGDAPPRPFGERLGPAPRPPRRDGEVAPPSPGEVLDLLDRLQLLDADRQPIVGPSHSGNYSDVPIESAGRVLGYLRLAALPRLQEDLDLGFARDQLQAALVTAGVVLGVALLASLGLSQWLLRPLQTLRRATAALAAGRFETRMPVRGSREFAELAADFNRLATALAQNRDARNRWIADLSHELRTPLSILRGELQALEDGVRPLSTDAVVSLLGETERLGRLVEDLYQLALSDVGALSYRFDRVDLVDLIDEVVRSQQPALQRAGLQLTFAKPPAAECPVWADADRISQLLANLLANSLRYTDAPGRVEVGLQVEGSLVRIRVDDSAPGVPSESLPKLFEPLFRVETSRNRAAGGAGLGLAICRRIAEGHGGHIHAEASTLGGLRVVVELPKRGAVP